MKKILLTFIYLLCVNNFQTFAQDLMRITMNNGSVLDFSINNVKEMSFSSSKQLDVIGEWLWLPDDNISRISFNTDGTCISHDYSVVWFNNEMIQMTEKTGTYTLKNNVITIAYSNGSALLIEIDRFLDYQMVSALNDVFYKVREPVYCMTTKDEPISIGNFGDIIKYADNYITMIENNKIKAITDGSGYALVEDAKTKELKAYRVDVEYIQPAIIDWTYYFNKKVTDIITEFGVPDQQNDDQHTYTYTFFDAAIKKLVFTFSKNWSKVNGVVVEFYSQEKRQCYYDYLIKNYIEVGTNNGVTIFSDTENVNTASVLIYFMTANPVYQIEYHIVSEE